MSQEEYGTPTTDGYNNVKLGAMWDIRPEARQVYYGYTPEGVTVVTLEDDCFIRFATGENNSLDINYIIFPKGERIYKKNGLWYSAKCGNRIIFRCYVKKPKEIILQIEPQIDAFKAPPFQDGAKTVQAPPSLPQTNWMFQQKQPDPISIVPEIIKVKEKEKFKLHPIAKWAIGTGLAIGSAYGGYKLYEYLHRDKGGPVGAPGYDADGNPTGSSGYGAGGKGMLIERNYFVQPQFSTQFRIGK